MARIGGILPVNDIGALHLILVPITARIMLSTFSIWFQGVYSLLFGFPFIISSTVSSLLVTLSLQVPGEA